MIVTIAVSVVTCLLTILVCEGIASLFGRSLFGTRR